MKLSLLTLSLVLAAAAPLAAAQQAPAAAQPDTKPPAPPAPAQPATPQPVPTYQPETVDLLRKEAGQVMRLVESSDVKRFLFATTWLPIVEKRTLHVNKEKKQVLSQAEFDKLAPEERTGFVEQAIDSYSFYYTNYGSPLAYARPLDLICKQLEGDAPLRKKRILDFGYGTIGHLRNLAGIGADVTGVEVDPILRALYSEPGDTGDVPGTGIGDDVTPGGKLRLVHGHWPGERDVAAAVGGGYDIIISKNTLKNGFIHPDQPIPQRQRVDLSVDDETFVKELAAALKPDGLLMIYNICPAQKPEGQGYIPWADGRCPFPREMLEKAGLGVIAYNQDDTAKIKEFARALEWDQGATPMDIEHDLFAHYTLARKK